MTVLSLLESVRTVQSYVVVFMKLSVGERGHRPDTNLQKHVGDFLVACLDVVSDLEKMTLTNKFVWNTFDFCSLSDSWHRGHFIYFIAIFINPEWHTPAQAHKDFSKQLTRIVKLHWQLQSFMHVIKGRQSLSMCFQSFQGDLQTDTWRPRHPNHLRCQHVQAPSSTEVAATISMKGMRNKRKWDVLAHKAQISLKSHSVSQLNTTTHYDIQICKGNHYILFLFCCVGVNSGYQSLSRRPVVPSQ